MEKQVWYQKGAQSNFQKGKISIFERSPSGDTSRDKLVAETSKKFCFYDTLKNAAKLSSAPDMLEALELVIEQMSNPENANYTFGNFVNGSCFHMMKQAVLKARGKIFS